jgi:flavin reductase (DIM6/NTAB) family NADH-FMN oxidoreductase RutF
MTQTIVPRPIAWLISENSDKTYNLAPFSYFNALSSDPPMIMVSIGLKPDGEKKDTRINIEQRKHFVVNIAHKEMAEALTASSASMAPGVSEIDELSLDTCPMPGSSVPRLTDCRIAYACELDSIHMIKDQAIVFARLSDLYIDDSVAGEDEKGRLKVSADAVDALGRLGGGEYVTAGKTVSIQRPD